MTSIDSCEPSVVGVDGDDARWMDEALSLAERGRGETSPNPMVGAIVVSAEGELVGRGFHQCAGGPHAEVLALNASLRKTRGATLYCTLEPCCHSGRTGPCTERIVEAGISRVVIGAIDPNPKVSGRGVGYLRARGLEVEVGLRARQASRLNEAFVTWIRQGRPFVTLKVAISKDGKVSSKKGERTAITSEQANQFIHKIRSEVDAIGIGSGTLVVDDPCLTVRGYERVRPLVRVVFDRRLRTPVNGQLFRTIEQGPVLVMTDEEAADSRPQIVKELSDRGVSVEILSDGRLSTALNRLAELEVTSLVLEGGSAIHRSAWRAGLVDRVHRFRAPFVIGKQGLPWIDDELIVDRLLDVRFDRLGPDEFTEGYVQRVD